MKRGKNCAEAVEKKKRMQRGESRENWFTKTKGRRKEENGEDKGEEKKKKMNVKGKGINKM